MGQLTVQEFMTPFPHTIGAEQKLPKAKEMMEQYDVRHLPVLQAGQLVGVITDRDIRFAESLKDINDNELPVEEAFTPDPHQSAPQSPLVDVCRLMEEKKIGCMLITDGGKLVGIFTWIDALKAIIKLNQ